MTANYRVISTQKSSQLWRWALLGLLCIAKFTPVYSQSVQFQVSSQKNLLENVALIVNDSIIAQTNVEGIAHADANLIAGQTILFSAIGYPNQYVEIPLTDIASHYDIVFPEQENVLDEIVITAGRKPEHISTVPSSVTILNQQDIQAQSNITSNLSAILGNAVPGLGTTTNKATNAGQTLRGRAVLVLVDGIPQSTPLMNGSRDLRTIDPLVIERIEVIKGATSIYGNGSGGGIINYITKKNKNAQFFGGQSVVGTSFNPLHGKDTWGYRVGHYFSGRKNQWDYTFGGSIDYTGLQRDADGKPLGQTDGLSNVYQYNAFLKMRYQINTHAALQWMYNYYGSTQHAKYISENGVYGQTPTIGVPGEEPGKPAGTPYNHNAMLTYTHDQLFVNTQLDVTAYFNSFSSMNRYVALGTAWYGPGQTMINSDKKGIRINFNTPFAVNSNFAEVTYGLDILNDITYQELTDGRVYIPKMNMVNVAPYAQLRMDFFNHLIFKGGVRYENANVKVKDFNTIATGPDGEGSIFVSGGDIPYSALMFNAGLRYTKYAYFNPFVSFSQGFAINELGRILRRATENTLENLATDPIITNNYEIGFSSRYSIFNLSASYYISTSDLGVNLVDVGGYLMPQREPEKVKGFEVALDARVLPTLSIGGSYAYVEGKATLDDGSEVYLNGSRISPPKLTGYLTYRPTELWNLQLFWINTGARDRFAPKDNGKYNNSEGPISAIHLFNFSGSYQIHEQWRVSLGVENIFNRKYFPTVSQYRALDAEYVLGNGMTANINVYFKF